ncbi:hypothetical protein BCV69DRAFT_280165 [Microstroma glucosiphilum]|uniref:Uncharacterized protein n=1 Tax=Pseudomicrostroma glucosiphilum TaxID=1684307 RepID=A0A316UH88_9BASI|nr:hypothetical protein BCV69DRAFT_280165 [Pseudomicrostroma glucosiphilum]PWN24274.1 hypothetical protein BCV69DRAFT_280165 [Pseudomicrostroma glucosiphilum]
MTTKATTTKAEAPPIAPMSPMVISSIVLPIAAILLYIPYTFHTGLFHSSFALKAETLRADLNLDSCSRLVTPADMGWCAEPVVQKSTGMAYFVCDDSRPWWDPVRMIWEQAPPGKQGGSLWAWDLKDQSSSPRQLELTSQVDAMEIFHPLSVSVMPSSNGDSPDANILLIANHPFADSAGSVDVYRHPLGDGDGMNHVAFYDRIAGDALDGQSPYRVEAVNEQWGLPISPAVAGGGPDIKVPSFLFTAVPSPDKPKGGLGPMLRGSGTVLSRKPTLLEYLADVFLPTRPSPPKDVFYHLSTAYRTKSAFATTTAYPHHPPLVRAWDGAGKEGGSNSSMHNVFVTGTAAKDSLFEQWDQHWVRGPHYGEAMATNQKVSTSVQVRWPSFVTIWNKGFEKVLRAISVDSLGRLWTVSSADEGLSEKLVETLRMGNSTEDIQPGVLVYQTTFVHRIGAAFAHPWELQRIGSAKKKGQWLTKEFFTSLIYRRGTKGDKDVGFLPKAPTGIAVDDERKRIIVTSSWDKGIAVCQWKDGWVEM